MNITTLSQLVALTDVDGVGDRRALELYRTFPDLQSLYASSFEAFEEFHYIDHGAYEQLQSLEPAISKCEQRFEACHEAGIQVISVADDAYPQELLRNHAPLTLYAKGDTDLLSHRSASFSGSRETGERGQEWARDVAAELATDGYAIVSGGATGTDTAAHRGALDATGQTIVVFGTGLHQPYPEENEHLFDEILEAGGLLLSHRPPNAGPTREGFLRRNKTTSALSRAIVIVATDGSGGTMSQYRDAQSQGRQVFVPTPDFGFEPGSGIEQIAFDDATMIVRGPEEIHEWYQESQETTRSDADSQNCNSNGQTSLDEW